MNGQTLPVDHGAPFAAARRAPARLQKAKYVLRIEAVEISKFGLGKGGFWKPRATMDAGI